MYNSLMKNTISIDELKAVLSYNPDTGIFKWNTTGHGHRKHLIAGSRNKYDGYVKIYIKPYRYAAHQLAWFYIHGEIPSSRIDHKNGVRHDNRISNLRKATAVENARHHKVPKDSSSGVSGVHFAKERGGKWIAVMNLPEKTIRKRFDVFEEAVAFRKKLEQIHYMEFAPYG